VAGVGHDFHHDRGERREKTGEPRDDVAFAEALGDGDSQSAGRRRLEGTHLGSRGVGFVEQPPTAGIEAHPGIGWADAAGGPLEQSHAQTLLQSAYSVADRGLCRLQVRRGSGEAAGFDHACKCLDTGETLHRLIVRPGERCVQNYRL